MATFWAKKPYRGIVLELHFFRNQVKTNQVWYQGENPRLDLLKMNTVQSAASTLLCRPPWKQHHTVTHRPAIYTRLFLQNLSLQSMIFFLIPELVSLLSDS